LERVSSEEAVLQPGEARYCLLEWLLSKLYEGSETPPSVRDPVRDPVEKRDENARTARIAKMFSLMGFPVTDTEIKGSGDLCDPFLLEVLEIVAAFALPDVSDCSLEEQSARDGALVASIVTMQEEVFAADYDLIPMDMRYAILAHKGNLKTVRAKLSQAKAQLAVVQAQLADLPPPRQETGPSGRQPLEADGLSLADVAAEVCAQLKTFLEEALAFQHHYTQDIRPWTNSVATRQPLQGIGPAANRCLEAYGGLEQVLNALQQLQHAEQAINTLGSGQELAAIVHRCDASYTQLSEALKLIDSRVAT